MGDNLFGVCRSKRECVNVRNHGAAQSAWWSGMAGIVSSADRANVQLAQRIFRRRHQTLALDPSDSQGGDAQSGFTREVWVGCLAEVAKLRSLRAGSSTE